jgi:TRAP transporter TAXI family solute receptor
MRYSTFATVVAATLMAVSGAQAQDRTGWPTSLTIGTASQGGPYFIYGNGLAAFISEELGIPASGEVTGGPVQNVTLTQVGDMDIGFITMGPAFEAMNGMSELAPGMPHTEIRALFPMYETPFHGVTLRSTGITTVSDVAGRRINMGPAGGTAGTYWPRFMETLGVSGTVSNAGWADASGQMQDGLIDVVLTAAGLPVPAFSQLSVETDTVIFGFTADELATILEAHPEVASFLIPGETYSGQSEELQSVAMWNYAIVHADMPESLAYEITKMVMENNERMVQIHASAAATLPENAVPNNSFLPFHPGAVRYFEEIGIQIPDDLRG